MFRGGVLGRCCAGQGHRVIGHVYPAAPLVGGFFNGHASLYWYKVLLEWWLDRFMSISKANEVCHFTEVKPGVVV